METQQLIVLPRTAISKPLMPWFWKYQDLLFNIAYRLLADEDASADAVQEAFISAFRNLSSFHDGSFSKLAGAHYCERMLR